MCSILIGVKGKESRECGAYPTVDKMDEDT